MVSPDGNPTDGDESMSLKPSIKQVSETPWHGWSPAKTSV